MTTDPSSNPGGDRVGAESLMAEPDERGRFGEFGGRYVPETLVPACAELERAFREAWSDPVFTDELDRLLRDYAGRPSALTDCRNLSEVLGFRVLLKREDLNHTGSHKINNVLGQTLLAKRMGKTRIVAETGAGQHGVATATAAAYFGQECVVYMGEVDIARQALNVFRMRLLGAEVRPATSGSRTLKDAVNEAMRDWVATVDSTYYCLGLGHGSSPVPVDGQGIPQGHRPRSLRTEHRSARRGRTGCDRGLRRRWFQCGRDLLRFRRHPGRVGRGRAGGGRRRRAGRTGCGPRLDVVPDAGRVRAGPGGPVDLGRTRLPGGRTGACVPGRHRAGPLRTGHRFRGAWRHSSCWPGARASFPPSSRPTGWRG